MQREITRASVLAAFAASVGMFVGATPMISATASLFIKPLAAEFDLSRTAISAILLMSPWTVALLAPFGGRALDRWGVRKVILPVLAIFAACHFLLYFTNSIWQVIFFYVVLGACASVHTYSAYTKVIAMWFTRNRGLALGLMIASGSALGGALIPQLVRPWIDEYGWRAAYAGMGLIITFWGGPILFLFLREPAGVIQKKGDAPLAPLQGLARAEAFKTRTFWTIFALILLSPMAIIGTAGHSFPMLTERGFNAVTATTALSFIYIGGMIGQLSSGFLLDRINSPKIVIPYFACAMAGVVIMHTTSNPAFLIPGAMLLGLGQGSELGITAYLTTRYFGLKAYGAIYGILYGVASFGVGIGLMSMGIIHDIADGYGPMKFVFIGAMSLVILLVLTLPRYVYKRQSDPETGESVALSSKAAPANADS